jgi:hypothetical protein
VQQWLYDHPWITYILIFAFLVYIYNKVFRMRKLPPLKDAVIYLTIAVGAGILTLFQLDLELPIVISLGVAVALMLTVRIRYWMIERENRKNGISTAAAQDARQLSPDAAAPSAGSDLPSKGVRAVKKDKPQA